MKKILLGVSALLFGASLSTQAQLLTEHFDYVVGTTVLSNGWNQTGTSTTNPMEIGTGSLFFPQYSPSPIGASAVCAGNGQDLNKDFTAPVTSGSVYTSFLLRVDTIGNEGYFFHLMDAAASSAFRARTYFRADPSITGAFNLGLTFNSSTGVFDNTPYTLGDTILIVVKYTILPGVENDSVSLYAFEANPPSGGEPTTPLIGPVGWTGTSAVTDIDPAKIALRQFDNGTDFVIDAFKVGTSWPLSPIDLPITWDETASIDYTTIPFGGVLSAPALDPMNASNNVLQYIKAAGAQTWGGVTLSTPAGLASVMPFAPAENLITAKIYSPAIGLTHMAKIENTANGGLFVEAQVTSSVIGWETVSFDFSLATNSTGGTGINYATDYDKISFFPQFGTVGAGDTFYVDSVYFGPPIIIGGTPMYDIATISTVDVDGVADSLGVYCYTSGVVMGIDMDGNAGLSFTIWDNEGINVFNANDVSNYVVTEGDSLIVRGEVDQSNGLTRFVVDSIMVVNQGNAIPTPTVVTSLAEIHESELVRINNYYVFDINGSNLIMVNGADTVVMRIDNDTDVNLSSFAVGDTVCYAIGIGGQFDLSSPYTSGYQMFPQRAADIDNSCGSIPPPVVPFALIKDINNVDANGEPDSLGLTFWTRGIVLGIDLDGNNGISFTMFDEEGINVFNFNDVSNYVVTEGDSIMVRGEIDFFNGLTEIFPDSIMLINSGNTVPSPMTVSSLSEMTESAPIKVVNVMVVDPAQWGNGSSSFNVDLVTCSGDTIIMRVDSDTDLGDSISVAPSGMFTVIGIGGQFDNSAPYFEGHQIFPMSFLDIDTAGNYSAPSFFVNEIMSANDSAIADANGEFDDWAELYNGGTEAISLAGLFFTNDALEPMKYVVPANSTATIPAGGYALVWCDDQSAQGDLHTNFELSSAGDYFAVTSYDGCAMVDGFDFPALESNTSYGRITDANDSLVVFPYWSTTPNAMNVLDTVNSVGELVFEADQLIVYPNPSNGNTVVKFNQTITFDVFDVLGNMITSAKNTNELSLDGFSAGAYFVRTNNGEVIRMIVK